MGIGLTNYGEDYGYQLLFGYIADSGYYWYPLGEPTWDGTSFTLLSGYVDYEVYYNYQYYYYTSTYYDYGTVY